MAKKEDKFDVVATLGYRITKWNEEGARQDFTEFGPLQLKYSGMDLLQISAVQAAVADLGNRLVEMGFEAAASVGLKDPKK